MAPSPSRSASSEYDTTSGSSDHSEVEQQPQHLPEQQNSGSDHDGRDSYEEESDEEIGGNGAAPKPPPSASNYVLTDSESEDDEVLSKKAPSPSALQSSSEEDTSSGSSNHDEVKQQPSPLAEKQNVGSYDDGGDSDEEESDEDNVVAQKPSLSDSNDMVPDSQCDDGVVPPKTYRKATSPSAPQSSSEEGDDSTGSGDKEEESDEKDQVPDTESNPNEALPPKPTPLSEESLPIATDPTEKPEPKRKLSPTVPLPQLKRIRPAEVTQDDMARRDLEKLFKEKCSSYKHLGPRMLALEKEYTGIEVPFLMMDDNKARELDGNLHKLENFVTNALIKSLKRSVD
jgi:hypothetical protein